MMMRRQLVCLFGRVLIPAMVALLFGATDASAQKRVALVIGNAAYQKAPALATPTNDAADMTALLGRLGFTVKTLTDARREDIERGLAEFGQEARGAEMALFYFAGRGVQIDNENWLIPVDIQLSNAADANKEAISLNTVFPHIAHASKLGMILIDAGRANPFALKAPPSAQSKAKSAPTTKVQAEPSANTFIAFSTGAGAVPVDGSGRNSPFTAALLSNLEKPGVDIERLFRGVRQDVAVATNGKQFPFTYGSGSTEPIYLKDSPPAPASPAGRQPR
jgi:uncharacterized caspase-like protein